MLAHYDAVLAALNATGLATAYLVIVPEKPSLPYWVVEPVTGDAGPDLPVCGESDDVDLTFRLKSVGLTARAAMIAARNGRVALSPMGHRRPLPIPGRSASLRHVRHEADYSEVAVVDPTTNRTLSLSIDTFSLSSTPA